MIIPATVPPEHHETFTKNYNAITKNTENLLLFTADHKMQSLNQKFTGPEIPEEVGSPKHIFTIAQKSNVGALTIHLGLMSRYASQFPDLNYIPKLDGKTNLTSISPYSEQMWSVQDAIIMAQNANLNLCGVAYTVYIGSDYEHEMLTEAATIVKNAHANGLVTVLWMYPRSIKVENQRAPNLVAGAAGLGASLGSDFVKINEPATGPKDLKLAVQAAGNTKVLVSGGPAHGNALELINHVRKQMEAGTAGVVMGRNIFQHSLEEAVEITNSVAKVIYDFKSL